MKKQNTFTRTQLEAARKPMFHTAGNALLTMDDVTEWLAEVGIAPYVPVADKLPAPTPTFVEAVLGRPEKGYTPRAAGEETEEPTEDESYAVEVEEREEEEDIIGDEDEDFDDEGFDDEESDEDEEESDDVEASDEAEEGEDASDDEDEEEAEDEETPEAAISEETAEPKPEPVVINGFSADEVSSARRMLARLVAEGALVPLNLLGSTNGDVPDFVCSPQAFSFIYTLRGDKTWKQPPSTSGGQTVSPLALHIWESLKDKGEQTPIELATEMGSGITAAAVVRALNELWQIGRVIPLPTASGDDTKWELTTTKFTRAIKAGANAGMPTAISALMSLYLPQAIAASSDEIETLLSPLAPRSRVREIVNNLHQTKQLESIVLEGKTLFFIPGTLPEEFPQVVEPVRDTTEHVSRYERAPSNFPVRTPAGKRAEGGERPSYRDRREGIRTDRVAARTQGEGETAGGEKDFTKPWNEERPRRSFGGDRQGGSSFGGPRKSFGGGDRERRPFNREGGDRRPFTPREGGERRPFAPRGDGERRPFTPREGGDRRPFGGDREGGRSFGGPRKSFGGGDRERRPFNREGNREGGSDRPFTPREGGERRPFTPRGDGERRPFTPREGGDRRPFGGDREGGRSFGGPRKSFGGGDRERRPFTPRGEGGGGFDRPRRPFTPREGGERRPFTPREGGERRPFTPRGDGDRRPFTPREGGDRRPFTPRGEGGGFDRPRRPFTPREGGERRPFTPRGEGGGFDRPRRPFTPREGGERRPFTPRGDGDRRPFTPREGGDRKPFAPRGDREGGSSFGGPRKSFGAKPGGFGRKPGFGGKPAFGGKPGFGGGARKGPGSGPGRGGAPKRSK